ncbi:MAG: T9SS type A sorting domain-containing protein [Candidatus Cloacimonetes bacterium]|nr:T9SS type A sorting domain-containing protein [Candidatus Cloacimonadota bacterium]
MKQIILLTVTLLLAFNLFAFAGGDGSVGNPYQVVTAAHLNDVRNNMSSHFIQTADIDLDIAPYNTGTGWDPLGYNDGISEEQFKGFYDGQNFVVDNLFINNNSSYGTGLFGFIQNATVTRLGVTNASVSNGTNYDTGILVGVVSESTVSYCYSSGSVNGGPYAGGLVGSVRGSTCTITNSYSTANVTANSGFRAGGLVGDLNYNTTVENCYARGNVSSNYTQFGGFTGGIGNNASTTNCYSTGPVTASATEGGGFNGQNSGTGSAVSSYWDTETSGCTTSVDAVGKNTIQMQTQSTFTGWDFSTIWAIDSSKNDGYPYLQWQTFEQTAPGTGNTTGTPADPDPLEVPVEPMDAYDYGDGSGAVVVDPDVTVNPDESGAEITVDVVVVPENATVPNPDAVSLSYQVTVTGTTDPVVIVLNFDGLPFSPTEIIYDNGGSWEVVAVTGWDYGNANATFNWTFNTPLRDGGEHFVMNEGGDSTLPVTLSAFNAIQTSANFAQLNWTTQSETGLAGYNVYRNINGNIGGGFKLNSLLINSSNTSSESNYTFTDEDVEFEQDYFYWLESVESDGNFEYFGPISIRIENEENDTPELPNETALQSAYPNPFNPNTTIKFNIQENETGMFEIFNVKGQTVKSYPLFNTGHHEINWNGTDDNGNKVSSGVFFYKLKSESVLQVHKMLLLK